MTLSVWRNGWNYELDCEHPTKIMDSRESASGYGGNRIRVEEHGRRVNIHMSNGTGDVSITHRTTQKLVEALVLSGEGEFLILQILEWKARREGLGYPTRWSMLNEKDKK